MASEDGEHADGCFFDKRNGGCQQLLDTSEEFSIEMFDVMFEIVAYKICQSNSEFLFVFFDGILHRIIKYLQ